MSSFKDEICHRTERTPLSVIHLMYFVRSIRDSFRQFEYIWYKVQGKENKIVVNDKIKGKLIILIMSVAAALCGRWKNT